VISKILIKPKGFVQVKNVPLKDNRVVLKILIPENQLGVMLYPVTGCKE